MACVTARAPRQSPVPEVREWDVAAGDRAHAHLVPVMAFGGTGELTPIGIVGEALPQSRRRRRQWPETVIKVE